MRRRREGRRCTPAGGWGLACFPLVTLLLHCPPGWAAGGHHAVDDAALLEEQHCQLETWVDFDTRDNRRLLHVGPGCRTGAVELGLGIDRARFEGAAASTVASVQAKWAQAIAEGWSAGVVLGMARQSRPARFLGSSVILPVTWQMAEPLALHLNAGRDFRAGQRDADRLGIALEWVPGAWSFIAERFREADANFWRAGTRWAVTPTVGVDLSRAQELKRGATAWWTVGLSWVFR